MPKCYFIFEHPILIITPSAVKDKHLCAQIHTHITSHAKVTKSRYHHRMLDVIAPHPPQLQYPLVEPFIECNNHFITMTTTKAFDDSDNFQVL